MTRRHGPLAAAEVAKGATQVAPLLEGDAEQVLAALAAAGVVIEAVDGRLRLSPRSAVDEALAARVAAHKPAILSLLASRPDPAALWRQAVELVAGTVEIPPDVLEALYAARVAWRPLKDR